MKIESKNSKIIGRPKGGIPWNKGMKYTTKQKEKLNFSGLSGVNGKPPWNKGLKHTKESIKKMSLSHKKWHESNAHPMLGKKHSEETKSHWRETRRNKPHPHKGYYMTLKTRTKLSNANKGDKHYNWKGGITKENATIRRSMRYRIWRNKVLERDDFTCQSCRKRGGYLNVDHKYPFAYFPELRFEIENGRTLCIDCHKKTITYKRRFGSLDDVKNAILYGFLKDGEETHCPKGYLWWYGLAIQTKNRPPHSVVKET